MWLNEKVQSKREEGIAGSSLRAHTQDRKNKAKIKSDPETRFTGFLLEAHR
jgi:hypothetical protein